MMSSFNSVIQLLVVLASTRTTSFSSALLLSRSYFKIVKLMFSRSYNKKDKMKNHLDIILCIVL